MHGPDQTKPIMCAFNIPNVRTITVTFPQSLITQEEFVAVVKATLEDCISVPEAGSASDREQAIREIRNLLQCLEDGPVSFVHRGSVFCKTLPPSRWANSDKTKIIQLSNITHAINVRIEQLGPHVNPNKATATTSTEQQPSKPFAITEKPAPYIRLEYGSRHRDTIYVTLPTVPITQLKFVEAVKNATTDSILRSNERIKEIQQQNITGLPDDCKIPALQDNIQRMIIFLNCLENGWVTFYYQGISFFNKLPTTQWDEKDKNSAVELPQESAALIRTGFAVPPPTPEEFAEKFAEFVLTSLGMRYQSSYQQPLTAETFRTIQPIISRRIQTLVDQGYPDKATATTSTEQQAPSEPAAHEPSAIAGETAPGRNTTIRVNPGAALPAIYGQRVASHAALGGTPLGPRPAEQADQSGAQKKDGECCIL